MCSLTMHGNTQSIYNIIATCMIGYVYIPVSIYLAFIPSPHVHMTKDK